MKRRQKNRHNMARIDFSKWQGTGNDFIMLDNREEEYEDLDTEIIKYLCHRNFGIGADGLIMLGDHPELDFSMRYFNSDGKEAEMCGNGARCIIGFANKLGIIEDETRFMAADGIHEGRVMGNNIYQIRMIDVDGYDKTDEYYFLNTGVPHVVVFKDDVNSVKTTDLGREIRNRPDFSPDGTNVNFVQITDNHLRMRTYERGVEAETLACGTGAVASAIAASIDKGLNQSEFTCQVLGGKLRITFEQAGSKSFRNVLLEGPAHEVFEGAIST